MFIVKNLSDQILLLSIVRARELELDAEFIKLLEKELLKRQMEEECYTQKTSGEY